MRSFRFASLLLAFLFGASLATAGEDLATRGARLAKERCAKCHGIDGFGKDPEYPSLAGQHEEYIVKQIFSFKTGQRINEEMAPMIDQLLAADVRAVSHHFASLKPNRIPNTDAALLDEGKTAYFQGSAKGGGSSCVACHGQEGKGGAQMPRLAGQNPVYLEKQLRGFIQKTRQNDNQMHQSLSGMSDREMRAVSVYLANEK